MKGGATHPEDPPLVLLPWLSTGNDQIGSISEHARGAAEAAVQIPEGLLGGQMKGVSIGEPHPVPRRPIGVHRPKALVGHENQPASFPQIIGKPTVALVVAYHCRKPILV
jgi:hypothetical protein